MRFANDVFLDQENVSATFDTDSIEVITTLHLSMQVIWTSVTCSANISIYASNDNLNWAFAGVSATITNNNGDSFLIIRDVPYKYIRLKVLVNSGSIDTLKCVYASKGF